VSLSSIEPPLASSPSFPVSMSSNWALSLFSLCMCLCLDECFISHSLRKSTYSKCLSQIRSASCLCVYECVYIRVSLPLAYVFGRCGKTIDLFTFECRSIVRLKSNGGGSTTDGSIKIISRYFRAKTNEQPDRPLT
jgi:hypothetical protein